MCLEKNPQNRLKCGRTGLEPLKKESLKSATQSIMDDEDIQDLKDAAETAGKLLEAEKELLNALF